MLLYDIAVTAATVIVLVYVSALTVAGRCKFNVVSNANEPIPDVAAVLKIVEGAAEVVSMATGTPPPVGAEVSGSMVVPLVLTPEASVIVLATFVTDNVPVLARVLVAPVLENWVAPSVTCHPRPEPLASTTARENAPPPVPVLVTSCAVPFKVSVKARVFGASMVRLPPVRVRVAAVLLLAPGEFANATPEAPMVMAIVATSPAATLRERILFLNIVFLSNFC
jgi:hypothetical protein